MSCKLIPTEEQEQRTLAQWLDLHGILWCHVPNGGPRSQITGAKLKAQGVKPGVPDVLVFDLPRTPSKAYVGVAIELKRRKGGQVSQDQKRWLSLLEQRGWLVAVCRGANEAIDLLERLGYGRREATG